MEDVYLLKVGVVRGVCGVWKCTGLIAGWLSCSPVLGSDRENSDTALCTTTHTHTSKL